MHINLSVTQPSGESASYTLAHATGRAMHKLAKTIRDAQPGDVISMTSPLTVKGNDHSFTIGHRETDGYEAFKWLWRESLTHNMAYRTPERLRDFLEVLDRLRKIDPATAPQLMFDVDGVAADFDLHYFEHFDTHYILDGMERMWANIDSRSDYYTYQPTYPLFDRLYKAVAHLSPKFLTSCRISAHADCKNRWATAAFGPTATLLPILPGPDGKFNKNSAFVQHSILIDDYDLNVDRWREQGGHAISHHCVIDTASQLLNILETPK